MREVRTARREVSAATGATAAAPLAGAPKTRPMRGFGWRKTLVRPGVIFLAAVALLVVVAPMWPGFDPFRIDLDALLEPPSLAHLLGTDENGRSVAQRLIQGGRVSLGIGVAGAALSVMIGAVLGMPAGARGGVADVLLMRFVDFALAFPTIFIIIIFTSVFPIGVFELVLLIAATGWMALARLVRGQVRELNAMPFIEAAQALGASPVRVLAVHLPPNLGPILAVTALTQVNRAVLAEATLSFLGIDIRPPMPWWGNMLMDAQNYLWTSPWLALAPGMSITFVLLALST
ncbi:MAG: ABC transporter permease, partial [Chloroflexi bacterium]|nr:ABC transporter permease [Chloroflexota bacterium]